MNLLFRLLPAGMSRDGFTCGNKALDTPQPDGKDSEASVLIKKFIPSMERVVSATFFL